MKVELEFDRFRRRVSRNTNTVDATPYTPFISLLSQMTSVTHYLFPYQLSTKTRETRKNTQKTQKATETLLLITKMFRTAYTTGLGVRLALDVLHDLDDHGAFQVLTRISFLDYIYRNF